jgi:putative inorganic carbon (hco3(-)) transporter
MIASSAMLLFAAASVITGNPVLVAALPIAMLLIFRAPAFWCLAFMCLSYFRITEAYPFLNSTGLVFGVGMAAIAALIWHGFFVRTIKPLWPAELLFMLALLALATIGIATAVDRQAAFDAVTGTYWKIVIISVGIAWLIRTYREFRAAAWCIMFSGSLIAVVALYNWTFDIDLVEGTRVSIARNLGSPLGDPNDLALVMLFPFGLALSMLIYRTGSALTVMSAIAFILTLLAIVATQSRGGLLAVISIVCIAGSRFIKSRALLIGLTIAVGSALFIAMGIAIRQSGGSTFSEGTLDESSAYRIIAWRAGYNMALAKPLTGVGIENFRIAFFNYTPEWIGRAIVAHSSWFGMLGELGFPGLFCLLGMIFFAARTLIISSKRLEVSEAPILMRGFALGCTSGLAAFCVAGTFLSQHFTWPIHTLVALAISIGRFASDGYERSRPTDAGQAQPSDKREDA